ncbi:efflux RND transporter periplasmic adaptor subunit [Methylobrevis albus]|uniref:Efflux RND transporter periplasmic adaptor subunit n=1 Tax=Methylobrevis albus TaxID=2793297 RepID=A0A931HZN7_9HYPH|nr:efflux RND transporter periplasmic adaptor subunit [Methylobrevis albus]MBH0237435.1 efflux RND transporter periplasmic adaptor subunit [Methylobrevis albus]
MVKRFIIAVLLVGLVCGGLIGFNFFRAKMIGDFFAGMTPPAVTVSTVDITPVTWEPVIEAIGTVVANNGVDVAVETGGIVKEIHFKANDRIAAGQVLVKLDSAIEEANLIAARAAVTRDQQALERSRQLATRGVSSEAALQSAQAALDASRSQLESLQATLDQKQIEAPFDGTIGIARIDLGQYVAAGTVVATLQDLDTMKVDFTVPEQRLNDIRIGQAVRFGLVADKIDYQGAIIGIDPKIDSASRLVSVQAQLANVRGELRPGQFIIARVVLPEEEGVIALPQTALISSLYGSYVYTVEEQAPDAAAAPTAGAGEAVAADAAPQEPKLVARQVFVEVGRRNGAEIEVTGGLAAGAKVITAGQNRLSNGSTVSINNTIDPAKIAAGGTTP